MIPWRPIAELPDELKDGREVLLWEGDAALVGAWRKILDAWYLTAGKGSFAADERGDGLEIEPTHFAEINAPGETARSSFVAFCRNEGLALDDPAAQVRWLVAHGQQWLPSEAEITPP